jgi:hypothetical protein
LIRTLYIWNWFININTSLFSMFPYTYFFHSSFVWLYSSCPSRDQKYLYPSIHLSWADLFWISVSFSFFHCVHGGGMLQWLSILEYHHWFHNMYTGSIYSPYIYTRGHAVSDSVHITCIVYAIALDMLFSLHKLNESSLSLSLLLVFSPQKSYKCACPCHKCLAVGGKLWHTVRCPLIVVQHRRKIESALYIRWTSTLDFYFTLLHSNGRFFSRTPLIFADPRTPLHPYPLAIS